VSDNPIILVIDDDKELLKLISILLKRINAETITKADGNSALEWLTEAEALDLVVLDLMLPDMDGLEILRRIRSRQQMDNIPVLILSAKADPTTIRFSLDNGADGYVTKPYIANNLITRVQTLLEAGRD
jgi:two-component system, OmpR family, alkaline phosphatase synthesis response regulator PhoP